MSENHILTIGLTGGIASGKSRVADCFAELGATIIDTDIIARELLDKQPETLAAVADAFGPDSVDEQGKLRRDWLRRRIFEDPRAREKLEGILHPLIRREVAEQRSKATGPYCIVVAPLLYETGFEDSVDRVVVVDTDPETQIRRLMARDGVSESDARAALSAQLDPLERRNRAHHLIDNNGDPSALDEQVHRLHQRFLSMNG